MAIWCVWHVGIWRNNDINDVCLLWYYPVSFVIRRFQILKQLNPEAMYGKCILMTSFHWGLTGSYCWFGLYWIMPIHITLNANSTGINWPLSLESWPQVMRYVLSSHGVGGSIEVPEKVPGDTCGINRWSNYHLQRTIVWHGGNLNREQFILSIHLCLCLDPISEC